jgi:uncharacterized protein (TIGR02271 family)
VTISIEQTRDVIGSTAYSSDGEKLGKVGHVLLDDDSGRPEFVTVHTGLFGIKESFVPLAEASFHGDRLTVPYDKDQVKNAPNAELEQGHLAPDEEAQLYSYYGLAYSERPSDSDRPQGRNDTGDGRGTAAAGAESGDATGVTGDATDATGEEPAGGAAGAARAVGRDTSGPTTDDAMTRSEEHLRTGTERVTAGRARLRKWVETEDVHVTVPVTRERARLETEPITDANREAAFAGPDMSEEEHEVTLAEERVVVEKETVPVERVRLTTETETSEAAVDEQLRKERIAAEGDIGDRDR